MKKDYTNKNRKFFENGRLLKELEIEPIILIFILNNIDSFVIFIEELKKEKKERALPISSIHTLFGYFFMYIPTENFLKEKIDIIKNFFLKMEKNSFNNDIVFREKTLKFLKVCIDEDNFSKDFIINYFCKKCNKNTNFKKNRDKIDFDSLLILSLDYPCLLDLNICSKKIKKELKDIRNYIKETNII